MRLKMIVASLFALMLAACSDVPAGYVGVKVNKYGGDKGVDTTVVGPGRYWLGWYEEMHLFPTFSQNECWTKGNDANCGSATDEEIKFQTREGMLVSADVGITYTVNRDKVAQLFQRYRKGIREISDAYLRNIIRDTINTEASKKSVEDIYGPGKVEIMDAVEKTVKSFVAQLGIDLESIFWLSDIRLPPEVQKNLNAKIAATQMAQQRQNEVAQARAEADKKIEDARGQAESIMVVAKSQAEANRILSQSLTKELVGYKAIEKWDGVLPRFSGAGSPIPFIDADKVDKK